jgi:hypothetical protein
MSPCRRLPKGGGLSRYYGYFQFGLTASGWEPSKFIEQQFAGLPADGMYKIIGEDVANFYGLVNSVRNVGPARFPRSGYDGDGA